MTLVEQLALHLAPRLSQPLAEVRGALAALLQRHASIEQVAGWTPAEAMAGGIPWMLVVEIQKALESQQLRCRLARVRGRLVLEIDARKADLNFPAATSALGTECFSSLLQIEMSAPVSSLLSALSATALEDASGQVIAPTTPLVRAVAPGAALRRPDGSRCVLALSAAANCAAVWQWCCSRGLGAHAAPLLHSALDDLFVLPLLTSPPAALQGALSELRSLDACASVAAWLSAAGFPDVAPALQAARVDMQAARLLNATDLAELGIAPARAAALCALLQRYALCSSVDEAHRWLHARGFGMYAFHFTRYNIPFYALPYVNMFILEEMGVARDDGLPLLEALHGLRQEAAYEARALAYWLRDLELERHAPALARAGCCSLASLAAMPAGDLPRLVAVPADAAKLAAALDELREFQSYYSATGTLLSQLGLAKFAPLLAHHAISVDVLALLTPEHLQHVLGISSAADRQLLLAALQAVRHELPTRVTDLFGGADGHAHSAVPQQQYPQHQLHRAAQAAKPRPPQDDPRSLEELLSFIKGEHNATPANTSASSAKRKPKEKAKEKPAASRVTAHVRGQLAPQKEKESPKEAPKDTPPRKEKEAAPASTSPSATRSKGASRASVTVTVAAPAPVAASAGPVPVPVPAAVKHLPGPAAALHMPVPGPASDQPQPQPAPEPELAPDPDDDELELDAEQEAALEREVEAFRMRLEQVHVPARRPSIVFAGSL